MSDIVVPRVSISNPYSANITSVFGTYNEKDPLSLHERPPERLVEEAYKRFSTKKGHQEPMGLAIGSLGTFSRNGIAVLKKFCELSSLKAAIQSEERWLEADPDVLSFTEISAINNVLWNKSTGETVLRAGNKSIDVASFSTLVRERYLDNFIIDVSSLRFLQDCQGSKALHLPPETHTWLQTRNNHFVSCKIREVLSTSVENELDLLCPLHMNYSHWGILVVDLVGKRLLFDDGYEMQPNTSILPTIKYLLDVFHELRPNA